MNLKNETSSLIEIKMLIGNDDNMSTSRQSQVWNLACNEI